METRKKEAELLQWHPAFYAGIQIELQDEAEKLIFENEHQIGTKPMGIDVLIIKKEADEPIHKNIGKIFRGHNIMEYKSPLDYLSIDDFYKVYGYACFYKADTSEADNIKVTDLTISYVCEKFPRKLIGHLKKERGYAVKEEELGIYYVVGDKIPIQIIVTKELSEDGNLWLKSLTNQLEKTETAKKLIEEYGKHKENSLYKSVMNLIVTANMEKFEEVRTMCEALEELMKDEFEAKRKEGEAIGEEHTQQKMNELTIKLAEADRTADIIKAAKDIEYQKKLFEEFGLV